MHFLYSQFFLLKYSKLISILLQSDDTFACVRRKLYSLFVYSQFVGLRFADSRFVYALNTKTSYSQLTEPQNPKM